MAIRTFNQPYDVVSRAGELLPRQHIMPLEGAATMIGTYAAVTSITQLFKVPANSNIKISAATMKKTTGGTAAATATAWGLANSLAGTGANTVFGTLLFGTHADNTWHNFSVTETDVAAGDIVSLVGLVGTTTEESQVGSLLCIEYREDWA